ncbi:MULTISPECIES: NADH-dependent flavin oxidoreductase [Bacillus]|uniref:NADH-dependent flavin oxidoreductase n=1 Tax=Bacillus TaxID=1386 RepID=UPI00032D9BBD|nr:hypothetical protein KQ1_04955 [Bacillus cereus BAG3O-1]MBJ8118940.1 NADH-dependent flavin oxidoreductase [Bacillus cereus]PFF87668.1 NADH-dependent flavin oxidoreductase [Bacillus cereus]RFB20557.1 NADH-dependent flavin oxidoreductase [Bacillus sp. LB(2018)]
MNAKYDLLFQPFTFQNGATIKNRISMAPMTTISATEDGRVSAEELSYYAHRANGIGMVITGCAHIKADGQAWERGFAADSDATIHDLTQLATAIKKQGAKAILQIFHAGHKSLHASSHSDYIQKLTENEIMQLIHAFSQATLRAIKAGFDGVEIHGANGFLIHQFFSQQTNNRKDQFGGSFTNRTTFPLAVVETVLETARQYANKSFIVGYRISPEEAGEQGFTMADSLQLMDQLANTELSYLHISNGDFWSLPRRGVEKHHTRMEWIMKKVGERIPLIGVGAIQTADDALKALQSGIPLLALGKELLIEPEWIKKIERDEEQNIALRISPEDQNRLVIPDPMWKKLWESWL